MSPTSEPALRFEEGVTLVGGGGASRNTFERARDLAPHVVAADGAAEAVVGWEAMPEAIIGDMDSLSDPAGWEAKARVLRLPEQDTTDLEKCLYSVDAPFFMAVGFQGRRFDHTLAALHALLAYPTKRLMLIGEEDVTFLAPLKWRARLAAGARVSVFPIRRVTAVASSGLKWPLKELALQAGYRIGVSNEAAEPDVALDFDRPGAAVSVPRRFIDAALASLVTPATAD